MDVLLLYSLGLHTRAVFSSLHNVIFFLYVILKLLMITNSPITRIGFELDEKW